MSVVVSKIFNKTNILL